MKITLQRTEGFLTKTWNNFTLLEQAIEVGKQLTGKVCVFEDNKFAWENEKQLRGILLHR